jgi:hypothetical protein
MLFPGGFMGVQDWKKIIAIFVLVSFIGMGVAWAMEQGSPQFREKAGTPLVKKPHKFPWLLAVLGVGAVAIVVVLLGRKKTQVTPPAENMVLTVVLGVGTSGTPAATASYPKDQIVNYSYTAQAGYGNLQVTLDNVLVANSGSMTMNNNHALSVSAAARPDLAALPYKHAADVRFYTPYRSDHPGLDITARKEIVISAPASGRFVKELYYHTGVPRWQVNCQIFIGDYAIECLFEPGDFVTKETAQRQFDLLIPDREVKAGDVLGTLIIAPGMEFSIFHWGVRNHKTGLTECPLLYATQTVRDALLALLHRDLPGKKICFDQNY